jgi:phosphatidylserine/phosphatidylglycerophosphate/cardiolipin synthase-like enzyme
MLDLIEAGARVYIYRNPLGAFLHLKLIVADGRLSAFGSANYNLRSQTLSREVAAVFDDAAVGELAMDHIQQLMPFTREVSREEAITYRNFGSFLYYLLMQVWG